MIGNRANQMRSTDAEKEKSLYLAARDEERYFSLAERLRLHAKLGGQCLNMQLKSDGDIVDFGTELDRRSVFTPEMFWNLDLYREQLHFLHRCYRWAKYGYNVFELTHSLAAALILTEPPPLPKVTEQETLQLPYPVFVVTLPPGIVPIFIAETENFPKGEESTSKYQVHWADSLWVHRFRSLHRHSNVNQEFFRWAACWKTVSLWRDRLASDLISYDNEYYNLAEYGDPKPLPEDDISADTGLRLIRNLLLWLDATSALQLTPHSKARAFGKKRAKKFRAGEKMNPIITWVFGRQVKLQPELRRMASEVALGRSSKPVEGWKLRYRHIVRGHWKMQPHGPERSLRKHIFISPYWKGPEGAAAWSHIYK